MAEVDSLDGYADQLGITVGPFGSALAFSLSSLGEEGHKNPKDVATIRMSLAHLKVMAYAIRREVLKFERQGEVKVEIPMSVLTQLKISRAEWDQFWNDGEDK